MRFRLLLRAISNAKKRQGVESSSSPSGYNSSAKPEQNHAGCFLGGPVAASHSRSICNQKDEGADEHCSCCCDCSVLGPSVGLLRRLHACWKPIRNAYGPDWNLGLHLE